MIGIVKSTLPDGRNLNAHAALQATAELGLDGLLFNSLREVSPTLDAGQLAEAAKEAGRLKLHISAHLGMLNPALPFRSTAVAEAGGGDLEVGVRRLVEAAASMGIHDLFFVIGMIEERFDTNVSWQAQREAVAALLLRVAPVLRAHKSRLLLKTHEEITTSEVVALCERVGPELLGVAFDPVNVVCRMEDPVEAAKRVAPYAASVHLDDAVLRFQDGGVRRFLAPYGDGALDWPAMLAELSGARARWIEMHSGQFAMPVFDAEWLKAQPDIALPEFASVLAMATRFGDREIAWDQSRPTDRLPQIIGKVK